MLIVLALPATINKETFIFFLPTLYPILRQNLPHKVALTATTLAVLGSGLVNVLLKLAFFESPGVSAKVQFLNNIQDYLMPSTYWHVEDTYGIVGPFGAFFGTIVVMVIVAIRGWTYCPASVRQHILIAAAFNFPLLFMFCATGELRNLSIMFVGFVILIAFALDRNSKNAAASHWCPVNS